MSADKLVFDLSNEIEGQPQVFIKKDWLNILDNMNQNYSANQTIIDTSQLSNSNKFMNYREAYLSVPLLMTLTGPAYVAAVNAATAPAGFQPASQPPIGGAAGYIQQTACDYVMGLKNWFGTVIHSFTLDMNGTTIIQQTPLINMVNSFRLLTSLSWDDVNTQGSVIGFYPDDPNAFSVNGVGVAAGVQSGSADGQGVCNNTIAIANPLLTNEPQADLNRYDSSKGNLGLTKRIQMINLDPDGVVGIKNGTADAVPSYANSQKYGSLMSGFTNSGNQASTSTSNAYTQLWLSYIFNKINGAAGGSSCLQTTVCATIYLKHIHNFFSMVPLLKGTFFKMTAFLNNSSVNFTVNGRIIDGGAAANNRVGCLSVSSVNVPVGGVNPLMISSAALTSGGSSGLGNGNFIASLSVGSRCLNQTQAALAPVVQTSPCSQSIYLYVPAYTFNPVFESAYLSSPVKSIKYSDYYQYQVQGVAANATFNNLLTNGIANIKSVLIIPYYSAGAGAAASGLPTGLPVFQSPFDPAGSCATSPYCLFTNFNVVISGQNAIYNTQFRAMEQFNNQQKGCNSVNGDMTDGLTSGLLTSLGFQSSQCYYYVNVSRQLPVEEQVPKSVQIVGQNLSNFAVDLYCFIEYGVAVDIDALTGARV
jgi:hypothetical protein